MFQAELRKDRYHNYLVLCAKEERDMTYQDEMIRHNTIEGFLPVKIHFMDNRMEYYYDITGAQSMALILEKKLLSYEQIKKILYGISRGIRNSEEYLLCEQDIILSLEYLYFDLEKEEIKLCFFPGYQKEVANQLHQLLEEMMDKVEYEDKDAVLLVYSLYMKSRENEVTLEQLLTLIGKQEKKADKNVWGQQEIQYDNSQKDNGEEERDNKEQEDDNSENEGYNEEPIDDKDRADDNLYKLYNEYKDDNNKEYRNYGNEEYKSYNEREQHTGKKAGVKQKNQWYDLEESAATEMIGVGESKQEKIKRENKNQVTNKSQKGDQIVSNRGKSNQEDEMAFMRKSQGKQKRQIVTELKQEGVMLGQARMIEKPFVTERIDDEVEVSYFEIKYYMMAAGIAIAAVLVFIGMLHTKVLYNAFGTKLDFMKVIGTLLLLGGCTAVSYLKIFQKKNQSTKMKKRILYVDPDIEEARTEPNEYNSRDGIMPQNVRRKQQQIQELNSRKEEKALHGDEEKKKGHEEERQRYEKRRKGCEGERQEYETQEYERQEYERQEYERQEYERKGYDNRREQQWQAIDECQSEDIKEQEKQQEKPDKEKADMTKAFAKGLMQAEEHYEKTKLLAGEENFDQVRLVPRNRGKYEAMVLHSFPYFIGKHKSFMDYNLAEETISRFHAKIEKQGTDFVLIDLNSTNGTFLNGKQLLPEEPELLTDGDDVAFSNIHYIFTCPSENTVI